MPADLFREAGDDGGERDRFAGGDRRCEGAEIGKTPAGDRFDEDIDDPAAGQPDGECIVVGDAVALQERRVAGAHGGREVVDRTLDATAGHRADRGPVRADEHRRTGWTRGRSEGADHRADADDVAGLAPPQAWMHRVNWCDSAWRYRADGLPPGKMVIGKVPMTPKRKPSAR